MDTTAYSVAERLPRVLTVAVTGLTAFVAVARRFRMHAPC